MEPAARTRLADPLVGPVQLVDVKVLDVELQLLPAQLTGGDGLQARTWVRVEGRLKATSQYWHLHSPRSVHSDDAN